MCEFCTQFFQFCSVMQGNCGVKVGFLKMERKKTVNKHNEARQISPGPLV